MQLEINKHGSTFHNGILILYSMHINYRYLRFSSLPNKLARQIVMLLQVIDDMIFAIGGFNGVTTIFNVECYDEKLDEWYVL